METYVVTGAYGYSGKYIAMRLLAQGDTVRTLTNSPQRANPFGARVTAVPFHFDDPKALAAALAGARVLINTYWVRFDHDDFTHSLAVENTLKLFSAAREAGVGRVVHVSITNPSVESPLPYFKGKALLERALRDSGLPHSILRPAVLFGHEDILINNIAWALRRLPVFGVFGRGDYRLQPICVEDFAALAVSESRQAGNRVLDAVGPETFTFRDLVAEIGRIIGKRRPIMPVHPALGLFVASVIGRTVNDVFLTREEIDGLMAGLLCVSSAPTGETRLTGWARENAPSLGIHYSNELARRRNRFKSYEEL
ncbi:MAG: NAD(P)H-binding protein [Anaerolineales bacterium]|nr:NAD(P)H-binding protein [Anaerolineales bacterium]